jgi:hypothetical protein
VVVLEELVTEPADFVEGCVAVGVVDEAVKVTPYRGNTQMLALRARG